MIHWEDCVFAYGDLKILDGFSYRTRGEGCTVLLGPSGCGKTTLLHLAAGLLEGSRGRVSASDEDMSYLFQKPRLLPWRSVRENIAFALPEGMSRGEKLERAMELIRTVGLEGFEEYPPGRLSGGMEQRCAIARAFAPDYPILLMDEPFKGLDLKLKMPLIKLLREMLGRRGCSSLLVTHDVREAILMGDRILTLDGPPLRVTAEIEGLKTEERSTASPVFYELEKRLYSLILEEKDIP